MATPELTNSDMIRSMERAMMNKAWIAREMKELRKKYSDKFVAVDDSKVLASDFDIKELVRKIRGKVSNINVVAIEFIPKEDYILVV